MTDEIKKQVNEDYQKGMSPLGLSLKYHVEVPEVYMALNMPEMLNVVFAGDQIDDAGPGQELSGGKIFRVNYTKN